MAGILIGTAILWILNIALVMPLTNMSLCRRMAVEGVNVESSESMPDDEKKRWQNIATNYYMMWDVIVLGLAGLIGGLLGYFFFGFSLEAKGWPGVIAFVGASLFSCFVLGQG